MRLWLFSSLTRNKNNTKRHKLMKNFGIYIHVPFCESKCPYCDFYSRPPKGSGKTKEEYVREYTAGVKSRLVSYAEKYCDRTVDTVYFGGGTPSVLGEDLLCEILAEIRASFHVAKDAEITCEANPCSVDERFFTRLREGEFNRLSMGLQSANEDELKLLGRRHTAEEAAEKVRLARKCGFDNISLDLMIALPNQTKEKLKRSIEFCSDLNVEHISSYILKIEENTVFGKKGIKTPDDDETAELYLFMVDELRKHGYIQYEISNFSKPNFEARHNTRYWRDEEYLGIGPAAHSYMDGKRFYFERSLDGFLSGNEPVADGTGGDAEEKIMLKLRLCEGLKREDLISFENGDEIYSAALKAAKNLPKNLINVQDNVISLTAEGFLVSNSIIEFILERI